MIDGSQRTGVSRQRGVHRGWVKKVGATIPDADLPEAIPVVGEVDELETSIGSKSSSTRRRK